MVYYKWNIKKTFNRNLYGPLEKPAVTFESKYAYA